MLTPPVDEVSFDTLLFMSYPEFINYPDGFSIDEYEIDKPEWTEGFFTF